MNTKCQKCRLALFCIARNGCDEGDYYCFKCYRCQKLFLVLAHNKRWLEVGVRGFELPGCQKIQYRSWSCHDCLGKEDL